MAQAAVGANNMGNLACVSSSEPEMVISAPILPHKAAPGSPGVEALMGYGDLSELDLGGYPSSHASDDPKGLGIVHLFRSASEEAALQAPHQKAQSSWFGKKLKKSISNSPQIPKPKPAPAVVQPRFVDDRPRFGLGPLDGVTENTKLALAKLSLAALLVKMGQLAGIKSVRLVQAEAKAREAAAAMQKILDAETALVAQVVEAKPAAVASASAVKAPVVDAAIVVGPSAPAAPALDGAVFGPVGGGWANKPAHGGSSQLHWAKGTGFGYSGAAGNFDIDTYLREQDKIQQQLRFCMRQASDRLEAKVAEAVPEELAQSCLLPLLESYLRNDSMAEMLEQQSGLYTDLFSWIAFMLAMDAPNPSRLLPLLEPSVAPLLRKLGATAKAIENAEKKVEALPKAEVAAAAAAAASPAAAAPPAPPAPAAPSSSASVLASSMAAGAPLAQMTMTTFIVELSEIMDQALAQRKEQMEREAAAQAAAAAAAEAESAHSSPEVSSCSSSVSSASASPVSASSASASAAAASPKDGDADAARSALAVVYSKALSPLKFGEVEQFSGVQKYMKQNEKQSSVPISRAFTRRLAVEFADLSQSLPVHLDSSIWMRVHEEKMQYAQLMIAGPDGTPYENGLFLFDVYFPPTYPSVPPQVNLCTTGKAAVRFNPNLYNCGKVCLSILGTWAGGQGEGWSAKSSTMLQVAVSIQSLVMVPQPYFNEPSYESTMHTPEGQRQSAAYSKPLLAATIRWAMLDQMKNPPRGFEAVVSNHFALKKDVILAQAEKWAKINPEEINAPFIKDLKETLEKQKVQQPEQ